MNIPWYDIQDIISLIGDKWRWIKNPSCKYVHLYMDMRNGKCTLKNRHGESITIEDLRKQY